MVRFHSPQVPQRAMPAGRQGFAGIVIIIIVLVGVLVGAFVLMKNGFNPNSHIPSSPRSAGEAGGKIDSSPAKLVQNDRKVNPDEPPLKLKSIGVNFEDFKFTKQKLQFNRLVMGFGFYIPKGGDDAHLAKNNPQPTFVVPLGTPVRSLVDGIVTDMPTLWSGDYSIQVTASGQMEKWVYETEHVINPKVKVGDKVTAGQIIAEVSNFDKGAPAGYGAVEIGILKGGNPPSHFCPFAYLDDSVREETFTKLRKFFKDWEDYTGDQSLYDESNPIPGCITLDSIPG